MGFNPATNRGIVVLCNTGVADVDITTLALNQKGKLSSLIPTNQLTLKQNTSKKIDHLSVVSEGFSFLFFMVIVLISPCNTIDD